MSEFKIYQIRFSDGCSYVGLTKLDVETRVRQHGFRNATNWRVMIRMHARKIRKSIHILAETDSADKAVQLEQYYIATQSQGLNRYSGGGLGCNRSNGREIAQAPMTDLDLRMQGQIDKLKRFAIHKSKHRRKKLTPEPVPGVYRCSYCRVDKPHTDFYRDRTRFNGLHSRCKDCQKRLRKRKS